MLVLSWMDGMVAYSRLCQRVSSGISKPLRSEGWLRLGQLPEPCKGWRASYFTVRDDGSKLENLPKQNECLFKYLNSPLYIDMSMGHHGRQY